MDFFDFFRILIDYSHRDLGEIHAKIIRTLAPLSHNTQELFTFYADDFFIKKFGKEWIPYLLEWTLYGTSIGGEMFFIKFKNYLEKENDEMIKLYLCAMKSGINGDPFLLNIAKNYKKSYDLYLPKNNFKIKQDPKFILNFFIILIFGLLILKIIELFCIVIRVRNV